MTDYDPRIVALYDGDNPDGPDHDFYRSLAARYRAKRILDVGCGTGILTVTFAGEGREVVGVDPSPAMISYARGRPGAEAVTWLEGYASDVRYGQFDLIVMSGNVAQHISDPHWQHTLADLRRLTCEHGVLAFESRNPSTRGWQSWTNEAPVRRESEFGPVTEWMQVSELGEDQILLRSFNRFERSQETLEDELKLAHPNRGCRSWGLKPPVSSRLRAM